MLVRPHPHRRHLFAHLKPDYIATSVDDIDFNYLQKKGITTALIDLDGTVVARGTYEVSESTKRHLQNQPLNIYIATNRPKSRSLKNLKEALNANGVVHPRGIYGKPFPSYYRHALRLHKLSKSETVMIGDRYLQDIFGANRAGLHTVAVHKLDKPKSLFDKLLSALERTQTRRLSKRYSKVS